MGYIKWDPSHQSWTDYVSLCLKEDTADYVSRRTWVSPLEVVVEEDPPGSGSGKGPPPPRSGGGGGPQEVVVEDDLPPRQGPDQTRPAEKYCWASGRYALEKKAFLFYWLLHRPFKNI